jgi:DNA-binding PadR family transcriptional regulator
MAHAQTELAVLGALSVEPMTGYELRNNIRDVLGHFWSESFGQIYPTLARLTDDGLVARAPVDGQTTAVYSITRRGLTRLKQLLNEPVQHRPQRDGTLLRVFFGRQLGTAGCHRLLDEAADAARQRLERFAEIRAELEAEDSPDAPYFLMTLDFGERQARMIIEWAEASDKSLRRLG